MLLWSHELMGKVISETEINLLELYGEITPISSQPYCTGPLFLGLVKMWALQCQKNTWVCHFLAREICWHLEETLNWTL